MAEEPHPSRRARARAWVAAHRRASRWLALAVIVAIACALVVWLHLRTFVSTDDAQVDGDMSAISARVSGVVTAVHVVDNQYVEKGEPLVDVDRAPFDVAVARAEADLEQARARADAQAPEVPITSKTTETNRATLASGVAVARAALAASRHDVDSARAALAQAGAQDRLAQVEYQRTKDLHASGSVAQADLDKSTAAADSAAAALAGARAALAAARRRVDQDTDKLHQADSLLHETEHNGPKKVAIQRANMESSEASVEAARAALAEARLNLGYTRIVAPVSGVVGRKTVAVGNHVEPGQALLVIVQVDRLWVTANFKETQLAHLRIGQRARVSVDAYGSTFDATVESLPGATGSRFSLFPPENATGNYVKVVQRLSVRLRLEPRQRGWQRLRPGMSVEARVYVR